MLVVRGTKKLRDRVKGPAAAAEDISTTQLGDWFATALFWRPQVALLVNTRTFIPVFMELAPAATLLDRAPAAIEEVLRRHGVDDAFLDAEKDAMAGVRIAPTNDRSVLGVVNEFALLGEHHQSIERVDLVQLSVDLAGTPLGPLHKRTGFPDRELAALAGGTGRLAQVIPLHAEVAAEASPAPSAPASGAVFQLKVTLQDTKPPIWRRVLVDGASTLHQLHEVIQAAFGWWNYHLHEFEAGGTCYSIPDPEEDWGPPVNDERKVRVDAIARQGSRLNYVYDFGDHWRHKITVEKVLPFDPATTVPALHRRQTGMPTRGLRRHLGLRGAAGDPRRPHPPRTRRTPGVARPTVRRRRVRPERLRREPPQPAPRQPRRLSTRADRAAFVQG